VDTEVMNEAIEVAKSLISIPNVHTVSKVVTELLVDKGVSVSKLTYKNLPIVIARLEGHNSEKPILLTTHMDVASPGPLSLWHYPPFSASLIEDKLYGRGSVDAKGGLASAIVALRRLASDNMKIKRNILLLALPDGEEGYKSLSVVKELKGCSAIVIEPTLSISAWVAPIICTAQLGGAYIEVEIKGTPSHVSTSWCAENPLMSVTKVFSIVGELWPYHSLYPTRPGVASEDLLSAFLPGLPTIVPVKVQTRGKAHSTPESVRVRIYSTLPPNYTANDVIERLSARLEIENASIKVVEEIPFFMEDANADIVKSVYDAVREVTGVHPLYEWFPWPTAAHILKAHGVANEVLIMGPGSFRLAHRPNEYVNVNDLVSVIKIFMKVAGG